MISTLFLRQFYSFEIFAQLKKENNPKIPSVQEAIQSHNFTLAVNFEQCSFLTSLSEFIKYDDKSIQAGIFKKLVNFHPVSLHAALQTDVMVTGGIFGCGLSPGNVRVATNNLLMLYRFPVVIPWDIHFLHAAFFGSKYSSVYNSGFTNVLAVHGVECATIMGPKFYNNAVWKVRRKWDIQLAQRENDEIQR